MHHQPAPRVDPARQVLPVLGPADPMLRREERDEMNVSAARRLVPQPLDVGDAALVHASLVGEQPYAPPAHQPYTVAHEHAYSRPHVRPRLLSPAVCPHPARARHNNCRDSCYPPHHFRSLPPMHSGSPRILLTSLLAMTFTVTPLAVMAQRLPGHKPVHPAGREIARVKL